MSTGRRFTAEDMRAVADVIAADHGDHRQLVSLLRQASETEAQLMGLVEAAYREGFQDGAMDCLADDRGLGGVGEDAYWSGSNVREALSKFRGEDNG